MTFGGKINDPTRPTRQRPDVINLHFAQLHCTGLSGLFVGTKHLRIRLLELQSDAFAHDAHCVHGIHQRFDRCIEQIALGRFNHGQ